VRCRHHVPAVLSDAQASFPRSVAQRHPQRRIPSAGPRSRPRIGSRGRMAVGGPNQPYPGVMKTRINPPHPQPGPIAFAVVCAFGGLVAVRGMLQLRIGTEPWWVSLLAIAMLIPALVFIEGGWLWIQR